jgi:hypothetical protein|tara:strand:+ start:842 stop:1186 length:345 start_codon:yes stop_codon:yes gene_type:complete
MDKEMKNSSRKAKSTKLQNLVRAKILKAFPHLRKKDVDTAKEGQSGPDIILSRIAKRLVPYNFEVKAQNRMKTVYNYYKQASKKTKLEPIVCMKANGRDPLVVIDLDHFFDLIK